MATTTATPQAEEQQPEKPGRAKLKRILLIVLIALVAAAAAAGATWFTVARHFGLSLLTAKHEVPKPPPPVFFPLDPMTVNLQPDDGGDTHYLRIGLTLKVDSEATRQRLADQMPEIRSRLLLALSNKRPEDLEPLEGKRELAKELAVLIAKPTEPGEPPAHVEDVLFTDFVVQ
ncbi:flagellar basal body-associated protein FliL [Burkholderia sp. WAC0059]|uniref:flagellar basal body-associated protein FliL n=1 Tax=Burkholderia sp. WAC0059 TaxID=2066022 RepID=UPI000C7F6FC6|nr:flagellar basal body-associated protein FliL [Burkholderia sp. WAC0059]PLZ00674.1 flagellar basal body-associated protein FliL [Burkholderia sp. WAC0059]